MKICLIVRALPVHRLGGLEFHTLDLANALAARGHAVTVVTSRHPGGEGSGVLPSGVEVVFLQRGRPGDYSVPFFQHLDSTVAKLDERTRFDIIHAQEFAGLFLSRRPGRAVCTVHGTLFSETPLNRRYFRRLSFAEKLKALVRFKPRPLLYPFFLRMLGRMDKLVVDSEYSRRELLLINPRLRPRIRMVPLGIDQARYAPAFPQPVAGISEETPLAGHSRRPLRIALLGRVQRMKGLEVVVRAASLLRDRGVPFLMCIGGTGDYLEDLKSEVRTRALQDHIEVRGRVPEEDVPELFAAADLFLFPDLTQPAFGLVAVEAMLHGCPVVAARSGAIPEVVGEEVGWLYEPWDAVELAGLLQRLAREPGEIRARAALARAHAEGYTSRKMAEEVESVYRELLQIGVGAELGSDSLVSRSTGFTRSTRST